MLFLLIVYVFVRSVNYTYHLNFSFDQAWISSRVLEIWRNKELTLVGPGNSIVTGGKQILQGSLIYYFLLVFLLLGNFDPIISSYLFMLFSAVMLFPLYFGVKLLYGKNVAVLIALLYTLIPLYIDFSRFFFGPGFQLALIPLLILFSGLYRKTQKSLYLYLLFFLIGVISQIHFASLILLPIFYIYVYYGHRFKKQAGFKLWMTSFLAFVVGFSPILLFELKNKFYNVIVFVEYLKNSRSFSNFKLLPHRYLSLSLIFIIFLAGKFNKIITGRVILFSCFLLLFLDLVIYLPKPESAFGMADRWNFLMEKKAYGIIKKLGLKDYNVANLIYDNLAVVIKYQLKKDGIKINFDDYYNNKYLFVIDESEKHLAENPAYEIAAFRPRKKIRQWNLNDTYNLYLFERLKPQ